MNNVTYSRQLNELLCDLPLLSNEHEPDTHEINVYIENICSRMTTAAELKKTIATKEVLVPRSEQGKRYQAFLVATLDIQWTSTIRTSICLLQECEKTIPEAPQKLY